jgi:hypothetical protein
VHTIILNGSGSGSALPLKIFDEMQNGAIWGHFRVSYNIKSSRTNKRREGANNMPIEELER